MKRLLVYISAGFALLGCSKNITDQNTNPKLPVTAPAGSVFLAGEKNLSDVYATEFWGTAPFRVVAQVWTQNTFNNEAHYQFSVNNAPAGWWNGLYTKALSNLQQARELASAEASDPNVLRNKLIVANILEVYAYNLLVNTYGNIPYTEALNRNIPFPKYDDAKTVVTDLVHRLDTSITGLNEGYGSFGDADQIYHGDVSKWKKFAASLKLKIAILLADADPATAAAKAQEAVSAGVFTSNDDNALLRYDPSAVTNASPLWQDIVNAGGAKYYSPAAFFINTLSAWHDPRLPQMFTKDPNGGYTGGIAGQGNSAVTLSYFSDKWLGADFPADLLDYSEVEFLLAEAVERGIGVSGTAASHYASGVTASILYWGGTDADALAYLAQPQVNYATATGPWRQKIGYQEWIALAHRNWDAWTSIRRLGYPNIDVVSPPVGAVSSFPLRFPYPAAEQTSNAANWTTAVQALPGGQDLQTAKLFWQQ